MVNFTECFYVNDEPGSNFLYTETIKLCCVVLYTICPLCRAAVKNEVHFTLCCSPLNGLGQRPIPDNSTVSQVHLDLFVTIN